MLKPFWAKMLIKHFRRTVLLLFILNGISFSQNWTGYTETDGLSNNGIEAIIEDNHGKIWVGTTGGLNRFDGNWISFSRAHGDALIHDYIMAIMKDSEGNLWIGTKRGLSKIDPAKDLKDPTNWKNYNQTNTNGGLVENKISAILEDDEGNIWVGTEFKGVCIVNPISTTDDDPLLDPDNWIKIDSVNQQLCNKRIFALAKDSSGNIWVGSRKGVSRYNSQEHELINNWDLSLCNIGDVKAIFADSHGYVWFGRKGKAVARVHLSHINRLEELELAFSAEAIAEDSDGKVWIRALDKGVYIVDPTSDLTDPGNWKLFPPQSDGLADHVIKSIFRDSEGDIWIGTAQKGISKFDISWIHFSEGFALDRENVICIAEDDSNKIWFGTEENGLRIANLHSNLFLERNWLDIRRSESGLASNVVRTIFEDDSGIFWIGTTPESPENAGLNSIDPQSDLFEPNNWKRITAKNSGLPDNAVNAIAQDPNRYLWFGTNNGLGRVHPDSTMEKPAWTIFDTSNGLGTNNIRAIHIDSHSFLWLGTTGGVNRIDLQSDLQTGWELIEFIQDKVLKIYADHEGNLWIGTQGSGVYKINPTSDPHNPSNWVVLKKEAGLASNAVYSIIQRSPRKNESGQIISKKYWFATGSGLTQLQITENEGQIDSVRTIFRAQDGPGAVNLLGLFEDSKGDLWIGTAGNGVTRHRIKINPPDTFIESKLDATTSDNIIIKYKGADINTLSDQLKFSYQIDTNGWQPFLRTELVQLFNLDTGRHVFEVRAVDMDGNIDPTPDRDVFYKFDSRLGGRFEMSDSISSVTITLHFPPGVLQEGQSVNITEIKNFELNDPKAMIAYDIMPQPVAFHLKKPATLIISFPLIRDFTPNQLSIFRQNQDGEWTGIGGTAKSQNGSLKIATAITEFGRYAVRQEKPPTIPTKVMSIQPRIFSPSGGGRGLGDRASISFTLTDDSEVTIKVYNLAGRLIKTLHDNEMMFRGVNVVQWDGKDRNNGICASGLYIVAIETNETLIAEKVMVANQF